MSKDKSILEKFTDSVKAMASSASEALKADEPPKVEQINAAYMPFAAQGLVSDPLLVPPIAARPRRRTRTARKTAKKASVRKASAKRAAPKKARKTAKTSPRGRSKASSRSAARKSAKRTTKRAVKGRTVKRPAKGIRR